MRGICRNCQHSCLHEEGRMCTKKLCFVRDEDFCSYFENDELFDPTKLVAFAIIAIGIVIFLSKMFVVSNIFHTFVVER